MRMTLRIGYRDVHVVELSKEEADKEEFFGDFDPSTGTIRLVQEGIPENLKGSTLIHEIIHALIYDAGLNLGDRREEEVTDALSNRISALFADNPDQIRAIVKMMKR